MVDYLVPECDGVVLVVPRGRVGGVVDAAVLLGDVESLFGEDVLEGVAAESAR